MLTVHITGGNRLVIPAGILKPGTAYRAIAGGQITSGPGGLTELFAQVRAHFSPDEVTFFEPDNTAALTSAVARVAADRDAAVKMASRAEAHARDYSWA